MLDKFLKNTIIGMIFFIPFIPFIVIDNFFFPFIFGKAIVFRILIEVLVGIWLVLAIRDKEYRPKFSWVLASVLFFIIIIGLADIFGVNPLKSFWSNFERMEGWVTLFHLLGFFVVSSSSVLILYFAPLHQ